MCREERERIIDEQASHNMLQDKLLHGYEESDEESIEDIEASDTWHTLKPAVQDGEKLFEILDYISYFYLFKSLKCLSKPSSNKLSDLRILSITAGLSIFLFFICNGSRL